MCMYTCVNAYVYLSIYLYIYPRIPTPFKTKVVTVNTSSGERFSMVFPRGWIDPVHGSASMLLHNSQETVWLWDKCAKSWQDGVATNNGGNSSHKLVDPATSKAEKPCLNLLHFIIHVYRFVALAFNHVPQKGSPRLKCVPTCTHILFNFKFVGGGMES